MLGFGPELEALILQDPNAKQDGAAPPFPDTQHPLIPKARGCEVALPLSALLLPGGGTDQSLLLPGGPWVGVGV